MTRRHFVAPAVALLIALAGGCSSDGPSTGSAPGVVKLDTVDFRFEPASVTRTVGKQVTVSITNKGKVTHNFSLPEIAGIPADLLSVDIAPGKTENLIFIAPAEPTTLEFFCRFHKDRGMMGNLQLKAAGPAATTVSSTTEGSGATSGPDTTGGPDTTSAGPGPT